MKNPPTLIDAMIGVTLKPEFGRIDKTGWLRRHLLESRRFVLDESMSAFSADLAYACLPKVRNARRDSEILDGMRTMARLPHRVTWIEFDMRARIRRAHEAYGVRLDENKSPEKGGWLFVQHPTVDTTFLCVECLSHSVSGDLKVFDKDAPLVPEPSGHFLNWTWSTTDDEPADFGLADLRKVAPGIDDQEVGIGAFLTGVASYRSKTSSVVGAPYYDRSVVERIFADEHLVLSWLRQSASDMRYVWSLLAAINDIPMTVEQVRPNKGYVARGQYRKFSEHSIIHLKIPGRISLQTLAGRVSRASRRRAHMVRGHWRKNWRRPEDKMWIAEHQRGDASLGFVTHDYSVERGTA